MHVILELFSLYFQMDLSWGLYTQLLFPVTGISADFLDFNYQSHNNSEWCYNFQVT